MTKRPTTKAEQVAIEPVVISPYLIRRHREGLAEWLAANGLDPNDIPDSHPIRVEEGDGGAVIRFRVLARDGNTSGLKVDSFEADEVVTAECTAPCIVPPPDLHTPTARPSTGAEAGE